MSLVNIEASSYTEQLIYKLHSKKAVIAVVGLGKIGWQYAAEIIKNGFKVISIDIQSHKAESLNKDMIQADAIVICISTPLDAFRHPDTRDIELSVHEISRHLRPGMLIILESTAYPGTTGELVKPILEQSGLQCGTDLFLAYSPTRTVSDSKNNSVTIQPKIVGGITADCTRVASAFYRTAIDAEVYQVTSAAHAEMVKIYDNTFRNLNIAFANEMAILCNRLGLSVWDVIDAVRTNPCGYTAFYPDMELGRDSSPIDPYYLTRKSQEYNYPMRLTELAGMMNDRMPDYVVERIEDILKECKRSAAGSWIYLIGLTYRKDTNDYYGSPILKIVEELEKKGVNILYSDPYIPKFRHNGKAYEAVTLTKSNLRKADLVVITTDHSIFDYELIRSHNCPIFDTRNALKGQPTRNLYYRL